MRKSILVLIGPSGSGKTTIARELMKTHGEYELVQSVTSRSPRAGDSNDYRYVSREKFLEMIDGGEFLEWSAYKGEYYGTLKDSVDRIIKSGMTALMILDANGATAIKNLYHEEVLIVAITRPEEILCAAIDSRSISEEEKTRRKTNLREEMLHDVAISDLAVSNNGTVQEAVQKIRENNF